MADENADRVYVPGADATPPARDVEPFWADEPETPVHGRAVPVADRLPPVGMVQVEPGVFRPADGPPLPPGVHVPSSRPPAGAPAVPPPAGAPAVPVAPAAPPQSERKQQPERPLGPFAPPEGHTAADSPWAQPLHRPGQVTSPQVSPHPVDRQAAFPALGGPSPTPPRPDETQPAFPSPNSQDQRTPVPPPGGQDQPTAFPPPTGADQRAPFSPPSGPDQPTPLPPSGGQDQPTPFPPSGGQDQPTPFPPSGGPDPRATAQAAGRDPRAAVQPVDRDRQDASAQAGDGRPGGQQPVTRPVSPQPSGGAWSTGHTTAVPPKAQPTPQPPHAAPVTPPTAHAAPADGGRGANATLPTANATPPHATPPHAAPSNAAPPNAAPAPSAHAVGGQGAGTAWPPAPPASPTAHTPPPSSQAPHQPQPGLPNPPQERQSPAGEADPFQELNWMVDGTPTAEEFARRRLARPAQQSATMGARAMLQKGMFGLVKLAPGQRELEYKQDVEMVRRNFGGLRQVTVVNPKGGAGKTVAVLLLAMTFGQKRGGYVLAWDNNETQGTLGMRAQQDFHARTVRDMMRDLHLFQGAQGRVGDLSQYVRAQGEGMFDVLASDESATAGEMLTAASFAEIRDVVSRFYKLIFVDTGNNVRAENWQAAMDATDQLVITMSARNDSAETAARALDHLEQSGRRRLVRQAVTIVTMPPTRKDIDLQWIQQHFAARTRAVLVAPYERLIDSGEPIRYGELSANTKDAWLKIAAAVADGL
nr:ParA family protein [Actinoplanes philippinensis]